MWLFWLSFAIFISISIFINCFYKLMRIFPINYLILFIYTLTHSYFVAAVCTNYSFESVMIVFGCTCSMFFSLTVYTCLFSKTVDILRGYFVILIMEIIVFLLTFKFVLSIVGLAIICIIIPFLGMWVVFDTLLILEANHKCGLSLDDYCIAAIIIYSDIMTIFLYLLALFGAAN
jgi:FtsH-binding integral membrane protein